MKYIIDDEEYNVIINKKGNNLKLSIRASSITSNISILLFFRFHIIA